MSPTYWPFRQRVRADVNLIRETGKIWIHERIDAINNDEPVPTDILTQITKMIGMARTKFYMCMFCIF